MAKYADGYKPFKYNTKYSISSDLDLILKLIKKKITYKHLNFFCIFQTLTDQS